jgi:hypothetical protein
MDSQEFIDLHSILPLFINSSHFFSTFFSDSLPNTEEKSLIIAPILIIYGQVCAAAGFNEMG